MTLLDAAPQAPAAPPAPVPQWRARVVAVCLALVTLAFLQDPGRIAADTKLDLTVNPWGFLGRALHLWDGEGFFGQLQNQSYGYLWPMGPFFGVGQAIGLPDWVVQRLWWSLVLVAAFLGMYLLVRALRVGAGWPQILAGLAYALAVRPQSAIGAISVEVWPMALAPWVLLPLVRGARQGNVVRAAALSALAVTTAGGVNAVAAGAVLPLAVWWLITLNPGPRRRRLAAWWVGLTGLAILWWLIPLVLLGKYSPPFLDWIESAEFTTSITDPTSVLRGADHWIAYLGSASDWTAGWLLASNSVLVLATGVVAAAGLAGLAMRSLPHRAFLVGATIAGLVLVTAGHTGAMSGLGSDLVQQFLDRSGAPLRNVHKFDLVLRLPLTIAFCHLLTWLWPSGPRPRWKVGLVALLVGSLILSWWPALTGQLARGRTYSAVAESWREAAFWLNKRGEPGRALIVPGASFAEFTWGRTGDEPLQAYGGYPWGIRDAVPLSSAGNIRALDAVEARLESGTGSPGLSQYLERMGVRYLVVRNDLAVTAQAPPALRVHMALANSPGFSRVAWFGDLMAGSGTVATDEGTEVTYPAVEIYEVTPSNNAPDPRVLMRPAQATVDVDGGPEALLPLADAGGLGNRPVVVTDDPYAQPLAAADLVVTDTDRRREITFGYMRDQESATMTAQQPYVQDRPVHDYRVVGEDGRTVAIPALQFDVSSSASDVSAGWRVPRGAMPAAALDGSLETYWRPGDLDEEQTFWQVTYPQPIDVGATLRIALLDQPGSATRAVPVQVTTEAGSVSTEATNAAGWQEVSAPAGRTTWVRIDIGGGGKAQLRGIREVDLPGREVNRLQLPAAQPGAGVLLSARPGDTSECAVRDDLRVCSDAFSAFSQDRTGLHRTVELASPLTTTPRILVAVRDAAKVSAELNALSDVSVQATSTRTRGVEGSARAAFDRSIATAWQAAADDEEPALTITLPEQRTVRGLRLVNRPGLNASSPLKVRVSAGDRQFSGYTDNRGLFRFDPVTTNRIRITFVTANQVRSRSALGETILPVGVSEVALIGADDLRQPVPDDALVTLPCGTGPDIEVDGHLAMQTSVTGRVEQFRDGALLAAEPCGSGLDLAAGKHELDVVSSQTFQPMTAFFPPPGYLGPTGRPVSPEVTTWDDTHRVLQVAAAAEPRVLEVTENFNPGWTATAGGKSLQPVRVDGWKQAYVLPAGVGGEVTLEFAPDAGYRAGLLAGLLAVLAVVVLAVRPPRQPQLPAVGSRALPRVTAALIAVGVTLTLGLPGLAVLLVAALALRRASLPAVAFLGVMVAVVVAVVAGVRPEGWPSVVEGCALALAWAAVLRSGGASTPAPVVPPAHN